MNRERSTRIRMAGVALSLMAIAAAAPASGAAEERPAGQVPAQDPAARALVLGMAEYLARAPGMQVTVRSGYDAIQADGQRIEFLEQRRIVLARPDKFRVDVERGDGERGGFVFDGRSITVFNKTDNVYARVEKQGTVDQALVYVVRDLRATLPLARMFTTGFPADMERLATSVTLVEECDQCDVPTSHVAVRTAEVDVQFWIAKGPRPLPRRVVITYRNAPGQPQFRAEFHDWKVPATADPGVFAFVPPAGAERIMYLAPRPRSAASGAPTGELR